MAGGGKLDNFVRTLVANVPFDSPIPLSLETYSADLASRCA